MTQNIHHKQDGWIRNPKYTFWLATFQENYAAGYSAAEAEAIAGNEPEHFCCPVCLRVDSNHMMDYRHQEAVQ